MSEIQVVYLVCGTVGVLLLVALSRYLVKQMALSRKKTAKCGHETKIAGRVTAFEKTITTNMPVNEDGSIDCCLECIDRMAILCAWCEKVIFIGDVITLYSPIKKNKFKLPKHAVVYDEEKMSMVGCGRTTCAETGADYAGCWIPDKNGNGKVNRRQTMIEVSMKDLASGGSGVVVQ